MDLNKRGGVKSAMFKSFFANNPTTSSITKTSSCQRTFKSSKKVVTSSGSKVAVYESAAEGVVTSETVGGETKTESDYSEAEQYCELEGEEGDDANEDFMSLMSKEMEALMNAPMEQNMAQESDDDDGDLLEGQATAASDKKACLFGICPEGTPCQCMDDCDVNLDDDLSTEASLVATNLEGTTKIEE